MSHRCTTPFIRKALSLILFLLLFSFLPPPPVSGQEFSIQSDTMVRFFERNTSKGNNKLVMPIYEYLRLDYYNTPSRKFSFHFYGWGRADLTNSGYYNESTDGDLLYGYLEYKPSFQHASIRLGRLAVYTGVATDYVDGLRYVSNLGDNFSISAHGGLPVGYADVSGSSGDLALGGRVGFHREKYEVGLSYQLIRDNSVTIEDFLAIDFNWALPANMVFDAYTTMNLDTNGLGEQNYALRFNLVETDFKAFLESFSYDDYFSSAAATPRPFNILAISGETLTRYGIDATRPIASDWEAGAKLIGYNYDVQNGTSFYIAGLLTWKGESLQQIGGELGYLDAGVIDDDELLFRLFAYWDQLPDNPIFNFVSGDIVYTAYGNEIFNTPSSFFTSIGGGKHFLENRLDLKVSADYGSNPFFDSDFRGMVSLTYRYQN